MTIDLEREIVGGDVEWGQVLRLDPIPGLHGTVRVPPAGDQLLFRRGRLANLVYHDSPVELDDAQRAAYPHSGGLFALETKTSGKAAAFYRGNGDEFIKQTMVLHSDNEKNAGLAGMLAVAACLLLSRDQPQEKATAASEEEWVSMFNGRDLEGWEIKIKDHPLGENYRETFRVEDSMIRVSYANHDRFDNQFGHLYSSQPYSYYSCGCNTVLSAIIWRMPLTGLTATAESCFIHNPPGRLNCTRASCYAGVPVSLRQRLRHRPHRQCVCTPAPI